MELLKSHLKPGNRVLDIGSGSGFLTACFANLVRPNGKVIGVDHIPELIQLSESNVRKHHPELLDSGILEFVIGDGRSGLQRAGPYHAIHVGAAAKTVPNEVFFSFFSYFYSVQFEPYSWLTSLRMVADW